MSKKLLLIGTFSSDSRYLPELYDALSKYDSSLEISIFNISNLRLYKRNENGEFDDITKGFFRKMKVPERYFRFKLPLISVLGSLYFLFDKNRYDIINYHFVNPIYLPWSYINKWHRSRQVATVWGSDFFRASPRNQKLNYNFYKNMDYIIFGNADPMIEFTDKYPLFISKSGVADFGNQGLYELQFQGKKDTEEIKKNWLGENYSKVAVTIGYNNKPEQQHEIAIREIEKLEDSYKQNLVLILPMTYPKNPSYKSKIQSLLSDSGISYLIVDEFLETEKLWELRQISDIFLNIQTTDMLSASLLEYLYFENIAINGRWLPYSFLKDVHIEDVKTDLDDIHTNLKYVLDHYDDFKAKASTQPDKIISLVSWERLSEIWAEYLGI